MINLERILNDYEKKNYHLRNPAEVKSGKEATVFLAFFQGKPLALKVYIDPEVRSFQNNLTYVEGKYFRSPSERKAVLKKNKAGKRLLHKGWIRREFYLLQKLHNTGVNVPKVYEWTDESILMEFIGNEEIAPRLIDVELTKSQAKVAFEKVIQDIKIMLNLGIVHSDLSAYNILWWKEQTWIIDLPQAIDIRLNPFKEELLHKDLFNLISYFSQYIDIDETEIHQLLELNTNHNKKSIITPMKAYFSTFTTGFSEVVREQIKKMFPDVKIDLLLDGLVVYRTTTPAERIKQIRFFNNTYALFQLFKGLKDKPFSEMSRWTKQDKNFKKLLNESLGDEKTTLKLNFVEKNQYVHLEKSFIEKLVVTIQTKTGVKVDRYKGEKELWFLVRSEGSGVIGLRLTQHPDYEKTLKKGQIKPEIAHLLCLMSEPTKNDIFLDPFAGSGAIPIERSKIAPYTQIIASDNDLTNLDQEVSKGDIKIKKWDALQLNEIVENSVDKIVTDPPWGLFGEKINIGAFYPQLLEELHRILKPNGILVLLISQSIDLDRILSQLSIKFELKKKINSLVNGQKASIYKLIKV